MGLKELNNLLNVIDSNSHDSNTSIYTTMISKTTYEIIKDKLVSDSSLFITKLNGSSLFINELNDSILITKVLSKSTLLLNFLKHLKSKYESKFMFEKILDVTLYHIIAKNYIEDKNLFKEFLGNNVLCFLMNNYQDNIYFNISIFIDADKLVFNINHKRHILECSDKVIEIVINENNFNEFDSIVDKYYK